MSSSVELKNLTKRYGERILFKDLNLQFQDEAIHCFLGPSGCGKTTLLKILMQVESPSAGLVEIKETNVGIVFQAPELLSWRTVQENICLPLELQGKSKQNLSSVLKSLKLENTQTLFPHELSGGMQMRVSLARALINAPERLFLDEPLSALDEVTRFQLQDEIRNLKQTRKFTAFLVTHSFTEAAYMSDFVYIFKPGGEIKALPSPIKKERTPDLRYTGEFQNWVAQLESELRHA